eukprot:TRINITY_DN149_c0_g1_i1.p1 TRINITY_DN149_c0_g1~~TRINITY_DN149_c0_g1_i1.p1  ORF type:complete len:431 (+),score=124.84 TRINITY_DN149_c0_g1_i1:168-1460(+)
MAFVEAARKCVTAVGLTVAYVLLALVVLVGYLGDLYTLLLASVYGTDPEAEDDAEELHEQKRKAGEGSGGRVSARVRDYVVAEGFSFEEHVIRVSVNNDKPEEDVEVVVHRLFDGASAVGKRPIILHHGLMQSSGVFVTSGHTSPAFYLARNGLDVWLANSRYAMQPEGGSRLPRKSDQWNWSFNDLANFDFPQLISYVTKATGQKPVYVGHSQGATQALVSFAIDPERSAALSLFVGLAPAFFLNYPAPAPALVLMCASPQWLLRLLLGRGSVLPLMCTAQKLFPAVAFQSMAGHTFEALFRWGRTLWPAACAQARFQFSPSLVATRLLRDWIASMLLGGVVTDSETQAHTYAAPSMRCPVAIISGGKDYLVDAPKLAYELDRVRPGTVLLNDLVPEYSHLDVLWAADVQERVFTPILALVNKAAVTTA